MLTGGEKHSRVETHLKHLKYSQCVRGTQDRIKNALFLSVVLIKFGAARHRDSRNTHTIVFVSHHLPHTF